MLAAVDLAAEAVEDHHRSGDTGGAQLVERVARGFEGFALVDRSQHRVVARFGADVGHAEACRRQFVDFRLRFLAQVARQAVGRNAPRRRQVGADCFEHRQQPPGRQNQRIAVGQEDAPYPVAVTLAGQADAFEDFRLVARPEFLLRRGIHLAEGASVPRTAVGDRQDQRFRLARRAEHRLDVADRDHPAKRWLKAGGTPAGLRAV